MALKEKKKGWPLGRLGKRKRKFHHRYKTPKNRSVGVRTLRMPGNSGFLQLDALAVYKSNDQQLVITITSKKRLDNNGPGIFFREAHDWKRHQNEDGSVRRLLDKVLELTAKRVHAKKLPEKGMFFESCFTGKDENAFLEKICSSCRCWYCDLSDQ